MSEFLKLKPTENEWSIKHCLTCHKELKRIEMSLEEKKEKRQFLAEYWDAKIQSPEDIICKYESCCGNWPNVLWINGGRGMPR